MKHAFLATSALALVLGAAGIALAQAPGSGVTTGKQASAADCTPVSVSVPGATRVEVSCEPGKAPLVAVEQLQLAPATLPSPIVVNTEGTEVTVKAPDLPASASITVEGEKR